MIKTVNAALTVIKTAQADYRKCLETERDVVILRTKTYAYEDVVNGLTGQFASLDSTTQATLQAENYALFSLAQEKGIELRLHSSLMPLVIETTETQSVRRTGKKLYPKTISFFDSSLSTSLNVVARVTETPELAPAFADVPNDAIDEVFDAVDAQTWQPQTYASEQVNDPWTPMVSNALVELAMTAAANANGLQAGLTVFSHNPLEAIIENSRNLLLYYTENNYANLNTTLTGIATNPALNVEYGLLRESIGGSDGLSACVAQLDVFKDHTDRLSGLTLSADSPNRGNTSDSTQEYINLYDLSGGPTIIFTFDARKFRSAKYLIQATAGNASRGHQVNELYILHDGYHAYTREIAAIYTQDPFVTYTTQLANNLIKVYATTTATNTDFVISGTRLQISRDAQSYANIAQNKILENHMLLSTYLNDGVDYVRIQSGALYNAAVVGNIRRELNDMIIQLSSSAFLGQSNAAQSAGINTWAQTITTRATTIQARIDSDYDAFMTAGRKSEALKIAFDLATGYVQPNANTTLHSTLNTITKSAIEQTE